MATSIEHIANRLLELNGYKNPYHSVGKSEVHVISVASMEVTRLLRAAVLCGYGAFTVEELLRGDNDASPLAA
jgi:hypothetical protein